MKLLLVLFFTFSIGLLKAQSTYFQQEVNYDIQVKLDDSKHELSAFETITYINNSPNELSYIYFHLWPNAYKNDETAMAQQLYEMGSLKFYYSSDSIRGYMDSLDFKVNGEKVELVYDSTHIDIVKLVLNQPLKPTDKITITTPFHVKIPKGVFSRLGHIGESYQITQWYPKPAVYDQNGWNQIPYLTQGEFYSEFGRFDVDITLPKNYILGATGNRINAAAEIQWMDSIAQATDTLTIYPKDMKFPESSTELKTIHFHEENIHDFAWFADKRYHILKSEVLLPYTQKPVTTWLMFTNKEADLWKKGTAYIDSAVYYYSLWNGDYPYKNCTAVDGGISAGGGMEYPTITVIGESGSDESLETVIVHEVGHNWFYGIFGSNEREHPWMDEGLNSYNEERYIKTVHPARNLFGSDTTAWAVKFFGLDYPQKEQYYLGYLYSARKNEDQPIEFPSAKYLSLNYGTIVYMKTAAVFTYLLDYLGEETMDKAMQAYYDKWHFKHPQPQDFQAVIEEVSGKKLGWLFDDIIKTTHRIDYKIAKRSQVEAGYLLTIKNKGKVNSPISISGMKNDSIILTVWIDGFAATKEITFPQGDYDAFKIDAAQNIPEINRKNNTLKNKGLFKKIEPLKFQPLGSIENPKKTSVFWSPIVGYNTGDQLKMGLSFYNISVVQKRVEYVIVPMYSTNLGKPVGSASFAYNAIPQKGLFQQITVKLSGQSYYTFSDNNVSTSFAKLTPEIRFKFRKKEARSTLNHQLTVKGVHVFNTIDQHPVDGSLLDTTVTNMNVYGQFLYYFENNTSLNPYSIHAKLVEAKKFSKLSVGANFTFDFKKRNKSFDIRLFAGTFVRNKTSNPIYNWRMDGVYGFYDYSYDKVFLDRARSNSILGQQFANGYGGFKMPTFGVGSSNSWLTAANFGLDFPIGLPLGVFADFGLTDNSGIMYDFGVKIPIYKKVAEVYFPLTYSKNIKDAIDANGYQYKDLIRFTLHLEKIIPFELIKNISL